MAQKNIKINLVNSDPDYVSSDIRYARIDNTVSPVYTTILGVTANPIIISDVPNGKYLIYAKPNYSDGRICPEQQYDTDSCTGINSLTADYNEPNIVVSYSAEDTVPQVKVNVTYPNGGFASSVHDNTGADINVVPPSNLYGTYFITMQPACDEDTGWFGSATAQVSVEVTEPSP